MPRKNKDAPKPKQVLARKARAISTAGVIAAMRRLLGNDDFRLLQSFWIEARFELLEGGKKTRDGLAWATLDGFDRAIMLPETWAAREMQTEQHKKQAEALMASISEDR